MINNYNKKVSVVTVVLNDVTGIGKTLKSVTNQEYDHLEYIVVDGGSVDGTVDVIKKQLDSIDLFISEPDKGIYDAMNKGAKMATGEYLYFLNSGDYFYNSTVILRINNYLLQGFDLVVGAVIRSYKDYIVLCEPCIDKLSLGKMPPHQGAFIKSSVFQDLGGFNTIIKSSADFDLFCRFYKNNYSYKMIENVIAQMPSGGFSSQKKVSVNETTRIIRSYYGLLYSIYYYLRKMLLEQGLKIILIKLRLRCLYDALLKLKMKGYK